MKRMDTIGWFIATMHQLLGHNKTAAFIGQPPGDKKHCILCMYEKGVVTRNEVIARLGV